jgi:capreomycidine synthase
VHFATTLEPFALEDCFRRYRKHAEIMLCSSGVEEFRFGELRAVLDLSLADLDGVLIEDSDSMGSDGLRGAIAGLYRDEDPASVLVTHGSSEAIFLAMTSLLAPGDDVVVMQPCYQGLYSLAEAAGCRITPWRLEFDAGFRPDIAALERLVTPRTRMIVVNSPNNPTGAVLTEREQDAVVRIATDCGSLVFWDDAFAALSFAGDALPERRRTRSEIRIGTLSKSYGLPGLRVGWCVASPELLAEMVRTRDYVTLNLSPLIELIAERALARGRSLLERRLPQVRRNLQLLRAWAAENAEHVEWVEPEGGVSVFPRFTSAIDVDALCEELVTEKGVFVLPGSCFGEPRHVRLGFGGDGAAFAEGLRRISEHLAARTAAFVRG